MLKKLLILFLLPIFLCACSSQNNNEITFSSWGSVSEVQIIKNVILDFERENPDIKVNFLHFPQNYFQKIHLLFASNQAPDVVFVNNIYLPLYSNYLLEIDKDIINKDDYFAQSIEALSYNQKLYAVPRDVSNVVFFYNKNLLNELPNSGWNFVEFQEFLKKNQNSQFYLLSLEHDYFWTIPFLLTLGDEKLGFETYKKMQTQYAPSLAQIGSLTTAQMFLDGKIAFYLSGRWMYPKISQNANFDWGIIEFPGQTRTDASGWAISKNSKNKEKAIRFVKYLSSEKNIDYLTQTGLIVPARKNSAKKLKDGDVFIKSIEKSKVILIEKNYRQQADFFNKKLFN